MTLMVLLPLAACDSGDTSDILLFPAFCAYLTNLEAPKIILKQSILQQHHNQPCRHLAYRELAHSAYEHPKSRSKRPQHSQHRDEASKPRRHSTSTSSLRHGIINPYPPRLRQHNHESQDCAMKPLHHKGAPSPPHRAASQKPSSTHEPPPPANP